MAVCKSRLQFPSWCFTTSVFLILSAFNVFSQNLNLGTGADLEFSNIPDITKINISQEEYSSKMQQYLEDYQSDNYLQLVTANLSDQTKLVNGVRLTFLPISNMEILNIDTAILKILSPPQNSTKILIKIINSKDNMLLEQRTIYPSRTSPKWFDFDVSKSIQAHRTIHLDVNCNECSNPLQAYVNALVYRSGRRRRSVSERNYRTDCRKLKDKRKKLCCRHKLKIDLDEHNLPEVENIMHPRKIEIGYCKGDCPPYHNQATNHSQFQSLLHQIYRKKIKNGTVGRGKRRVPHPCCSPSRLGDIKVLKVDYEDSSKLVVEMWHNMTVIECACH